MNVMERKRNKTKNAVSSQMENGELISTSSSSFSNIKGDERNIFLLFFLYTLQGIPLGLSAAIPMILQNKGVSYKQQVIHKILRSRILNSILYLICYSFFNHFCYYYSL